MSGQPVARGVRSMLRLFVPFAVVLPLAAAFAPASPVAPDQARPEDFVLIQKGSLPIIVSAPHGGRKKVPDVPERVGKGVTGFQTILDTNTAELAEKFAAELEKLLDGKPWVVVARFERKYLDANRPPEQGYESDKAKPYYDLYHTSLEAACKAVKTRFGRGLLLDIHGQGTSGTRSAAGRGTARPTLLKDRDGWGALTGKQRAAGPSP